MTRLWRSARAAVLTGAVLVLAFVATTPRAEDARQGASGEEAVTNKVVKSKTEWGQCLTPEQYRVLREKGTERAFTGKYYKHKDDGIYVCAACGFQLFDSVAKFDSGTGWPSFSQPIKDSHIEEKSDVSHGMVRTEVMCPRCGGHLGHVFEDGPAPTGLRYCINSESLGFEPRDKE